MQKIISAVIFSLLLSSSCFSETVMSYVNERGQTVYTNSGPSALQQQETTKEKTKSAVNEILSRHPEMDSAKTERMIQLRDHFVNFGNPIDRALLKAEKKMIEDGALIDHEAIAAAKMAAEKRLQRNMIEETQRNKRDIEMAKREAKAAKQEAEAARQEAEVARHKARNAEWDAQNARNNAH